MILPALGAIVGYVLGSVMIWIALSWWEDRQNEIKITAQHVQTAREILKQTER